MNPDRIEGVRACVFDAYGKLEYSGPRYLEEFTQQDVWEVPAAFSNLEQSGLDHPYATRAARARPLETLFTSLREAGLRVVDLVEPAAEDEPRQRWLAVLCERRRRRGRR